MDILILISLIFCIRVADCTLISQSIIEKCTKGDSSEPTTGSGTTTCGKKFVIAITLRSGQVDFFNAASILHNYKLDFSFPGWN